MILHRSGEGRSDGVYWLKSTWASDNVNRSGLRIKMRVFMFHASARLTGLHGLLSTTPMADGLWETQHDSGRSVSTGACGEFST